MLGKKIRINDFVVSQLLSYRLVCEFICLIDMSNCFLIAR